jgi:hypothetical protein
MLLPSSYTSLMFEEAAKDFELKNFPERQSLTAAGYSVIAGQMATPCSAAPSRRC